MRCSVGNAYAKQHHLLYDEHQNAWQYEVAVATCIVEYWHIGYQHRLCCKLVVAVGVVARQCYLNVRVHIGSHSRTGLEYSLIGKHQAHVAIHADVGLLHTSEVAVEVFGQKNDAVHFLLAHESACLLKVVAIGSHTNVGRRINVAYELAARLTMRIVNHSHGHIAHHLVVVYPRVEYRVGEWQKYNEEQRALVLEHVAHLVKPYSGRVFPESSYLVHLNTVLLQIYIFSQSLAQSHDYKHGSAGEQSECGCVERHIGPRIASEHHNFIYDKEVAHGEQLCQ